MALRKRSLAGLTVLAPLAACPLTSRADLSSVPGLTTEQTAVARGLGQTCGALGSASTAGTSLTAEQQDLLNTCTALDATYSGGSDLAGLQQALNAISGRQTTATARLPMQFATGQIANIGARLAAVRGGERGFSVSGLDLGLPGGTPSATAPLADLSHGAIGGGAGDDTGSLLGDRLGIFLTGTLRRGTEDTTDAEQGFDLRNTGATLGVDYRFGNSLILGIAGGYSKSRAEFDDSAGRLDSRQWSLSLYGSYFRDLFHIDWLAGYGHYDYQITRNLNFDVNFDGGPASIGCTASSCSTQTSGSTGAREYTASLASGLDLHAGGLAYGPLGEVEYKQVGVNAYTESGPSGLDLHLGAITTNSLTAKLGGYASYALNTRWFVMVPQVQVRYLHEFLNDPRTQQVEFAADTLPGAQNRAYSVFTNPPTRNYFDWKASLLFQFAHGFAAFVDYRQSIGLTGISNRELNVGLRMEDR